MSSKYISPGNAVQFPAAAAYTEGQFVKLNNLHGAIANAVAIGEQAVLQVVGVFEIDAKTTDVAAFGVAAYWDDTAKEVTISSAGNTKVGHFAVAKGNGDTTAVVRISPGAANP